MYKFSALYVASNSMKSLPYIVRQREEGSGNQPRGKRNKNKRFQSSAMPTLRNTAPAPANSVNKLRLTNKAANILGCTLYLCTGFVVRAPFNMAVKLKTTRNSNKLQKMYHGD